MLLVPGICSDLNMDVHSIMLNLLDLPLVLLLYVSTRTAGTPLKSASYSRIFFSHLPHKKCVLLRFCEVAAVFFVFLSLLGSAGIGVD